MDRQTRAIVKNYRGEAAQLVAEAAARMAPPQPPEPARIPAQPASLAPPISLPEPDRPPLAPQPALNQNAEAPVPPLARRAERRRPRLGRTLAWVVLAPWYGAMAVASVGVPVIFVKGLFGL